MCGFLRPYFPNSEDVESGRSRQDIDFRTDRDGEFFGSSTASCRTGRAAIAALRIFRSDSPPGFTKIADWVFTPGDPEQALGKDAILDNITLYRLTNTGPSSGRIYWQNAMAGAKLTAVKVPVAVTIFPGEVYKPPQHWLSRTYQKLIYYSRVSRGGHFAALETGTFQSGDQGRVQDSAFISRGNRQLCLRPTSSSIDVDCATLHKVGSCDQPGRRDDNFAEITATCAPTTTVISSAECPHS